MADLQFPLYGSLYLQNDLTDDARFAPLDDDFYIGPHCGQMFWNCNVGEPRYITAERRIGDRPDLSAYYDALVDAGISRIPPTDASIGSRPRYHSPRKIHLELLECAHSFIKRIAKDRQMRDAAQPVLLHPDLHKRNIFVVDGDPTHITGLIDWQSTSIEPAFWHSNETPDFAQESKDESGTDKEICAKALDIGTQYYLPQLAIPRSMDEGLFRPFSNCHRTWKDGVIALRHELIEAARLWDELRLSGPCPFTLPSPDEWARHQRDYRLFEAAQNLRRDLAHLIDVATDGWVPSDELERAKADQREMYEGMLQAALANQDPDPDEPVRTEADLREMWPFDL